MRKKGEIMEKEQIQKLIGMCDHTLLLQGSTTEEIHGICDDAMRFQTASICIPPCSTNIMLVAGSYSST